MSLHLTIPFIPEKSAQGWKYQLEQADLQNVKKGADMIIGGHIPNSPHRSRLVLVDELGGQWSITVDSTGALHTTKITL